MLIVTFAVPHESRAFRRTEAARSVRIIHTGIGEGSAEVILREAIAGKRPDAVVSCGFAGALDPAAQIGDLVSDPVVSNAELLAEMPRSVRQGLILTVSSPLDSPTAKRALHQSSGALAVDMETRAMVTVCNEHGLPLLVLRAISDGASDPVPVPFPIAWSMKRQRPRPLALCGWLLAHPGKIGQFGRFVRHTNHAARCLSAGLEQILPSLALAAKALTTARESR